MTVIALCSAKGAPGVSTTALGLAMVWPRPVVFVEADPSGGNWLLAGFFRGAREYDGGLVELAISPLATADALRDVVRPSATRRRRSCSGCRTTPRPVGCARCGSRWQGRSGTSTHRGHPDQHLVDPDETFGGGLNAYDVAVTVMPMADIELNTPAAIVQRTLIHAALTWATLRMVKPGGLAAVITNHLTLDANAPRSCEEIAALGDLLGAARLPSGALRPQMPGTDSVTDILLFSRRPEGQPSRSRDFIDTYAVPIQGRYIRLNGYIDAHPEHVLGVTGAIHRVAGGPILTVTGRPGHMAAELHQVLGHIAATAQRDRLVRPPAETPPSMGILAIHKESKVPHTTVQLANRAVRAAAQGRPMRRGPDTDGLSMN